MSQHEQNYVSELIVAPIPKEWQDYKNSMKEFKSRRDDTLLAVHDTPSGLNVPYRNIYNHLTPSGSPITFRKVSYLITETSDI